MYIFIYIYIIIILYSNINIANNCSLSLCDRTLLSQR